MLVRTTAIYPSVEHPRSCHSHYTTGNTHTTARFRTVTSPRTTAAGEGALHVSLASPFPSLTGGREGGHGERERAGCPENNLPNSQSLGNLLLKETAFHRHVIGASLQLSPTVGHGRRARGANFSKCDARVHLTACKRGVLQTPALLALADAHVREGKPGRSKLCQVAQPWQIKSEVPTITALRFSTKNIY